MVAVAAASVPATASGRQRAAGMVGDQPDTGHWQTLQFLT